VGRGRTGGRGIRALKPIPDLVGHTWAVDAGVPRSWVDPDAAWDDPWVPIRWYDPSHGLDGYRYTPCEAPYAAEAEEYWRRIVREVYELDPDAIPPPLLSPWGPVRGNREK
jgi:hypothetical protein